jgi:hypothetical protein
MVTIAVGSVWPFGAAILTAAGPDVVREAGTPSKRGAVAGGCPTRPRSSKTVRKPGTRPPFIEPEQSHKEERKTEESTVSESA